MDDAAADAKIAAENAIMDALTNLPDDESRINAYVEQNMQKPMNDADVSDAKLFNTLFEREYPTLMEKANEALDLEKKKDEENSIIRLNSEGVDIGDVLRRGGRRRRRSATARKSSSYRHRRTSKKRGTQRKQKRRQRRGSRRAY